jgi:hypothetical protein
MNILYFNQINALYYSPLSFLPYPPLFNSFQCVSLCHITTQMKYIPILFILCHSSFFSLDPSKSPTFTELFYLLIYLDICTDMYIWSSNINVLNNRNGIIFVPFSGKINNRYPHISRRINWPRSHINYKFTCLQTARKQRLKIQDTKSDRCKMSEDFNTPFFALNIFVFCLDWIAKQNLTLACIQKT